MISSICASNQLIRIELGGGGIAVVTFFLCAVWSPFIDFFLSPKNFAVKWPCHQSTHTNERRKLYLRNHSIDNGDVANKWDDMEKCRRTFVLTRPIRKPMWNMTADCWLVWALFRWHVAMVVCPFVHTHSAYRHHWPSTSVSAPNRIKHLIWCDANNAQNLNKT